ncbi:MAG TPA: peptidylprolyl isomerase [Kofleriaceae bacterium]
MHRNLLVVVGMVALGPAAAVAQAPAAAPQVEVAGNRVEVDHAPVVSTDAVFDPGESAVKASARPLLDAIAKALGRDPASSVLLNVYTDDTAPDNDRTGNYDAKLSQARADALAGYLGKRGIAAKRITAKGLGRDRPLADNTSDDNRAKNRRFELKVVGEVRPPEASDLAVYIKAIKGKGALTATIATSQGTLHCQLFDDKAPATVANFIGLATGQKAWIDPATGKTVKNKPFYDGLTFHRVLPQFMIQGGDPLGRGTGGPGYTFDDELVPGMVHKPGTLAMANAGPSTNGSQFFIDEVAASWLNNKHTIFGQCAEVDVVTKIAGVPRGRNDKPNDPVTITKLTIGRE